MIRNNNHSLMTICKYCLVSKFKINFSKVTPDKREIIEAIFKVYSNKLQFKGKTWDQILHTFYREEACMYDGLNKKELKKIRKEVLNGVHKRGLQCDL